MPSLTPLRLYHDWTTPVACKSADPDELFVTGAAQNRAKAVCLGCPVRTECLSDALDNRVEFGVWGGMTERERRALLRRRPEVTSWKPAVRHRPRRRPAGHRAASTPSPARGRRPAARSAPTARRPSRSCTSPGWAATSTTGTPGCAAVNRASMQLRLRAASNEPVGVQPQHRGRQR